MDFSSVLKNEIFRPMATTLIPGGVAIAPYYLLLQYYVPFVKAYSVSNPYIIGVLILMATLVAGLILEDIGSRIEVGWDAILDSRPDDQSGKWKEYLQLQIQDEYVGQRYLRTIYVRFKFELSMAPSLAVSTIGLIWLNNLYRFWAIGSIAWIATALFLVAAYLLYESYASSDQLRELHCWIIEAVQKNQESK